MNFSYNGDFTEITPRMFILFPWLITNESEFYFSEVKLDESYRWRHQSRLEWSLPNSQKNENLEKEWIFWIFDFWSVILKWIARTIFSLFLQNLIGRSGNSPWIQNFQKWESEESEDKTFRFFVRCITHWIA